MGRAVHCGPFLQIWCLNPTPEKRGLGGPGDGGELQFAEMDGAARN
jgi:hypothetical protein